MNRRLRISVADDEADMRDYFARMLPHLGHEVVSIANNGRQLVEQCRAQHPDLVITDMRMPDLDGLSAAREICSETSVPVLLVSAHYTPDQVEDRSEPVTAFLTKPIRRADLQSAIDDVVRRWEGANGGRDQEGAHETAG